MANFDLRTTDVPTGLSVIEASAGTGKTWTISHLVPRLLVDGVVSGIGDLLLVTFTEDAARELGEQTRRQLATLVGHADAGTQPAEHQQGIRLLLDRLEALPDPERHTAVLRLRLALDESDQLAVSTIHAFCKQVLGAEGFLCGMPAGFGVLPDPGEAQSDAVKDTWRTDLGADSLLAAVAACGTWSVEDDLKAWRSLTRRPSTRMEPEPLSLQDAQDGVAKALEARRAYGVQRVCRVWHCARSSVYARRQATPSPAPCRRRGPVGAAPDDVLVAHVRRVLEASPFHGEGYRKVWAKLRVEGRRTSKERVRRLMREHDLQAPQRAGHAHGPKAHDGTITTEAPDVMWGTDMTATVTVAEGPAFVFVAVDHCTAECIGLHAAKRGTRFEALEPIRQGIRERFGGIGEGVARGLRLRHDHGSNYLADDFQQEVAFFGIESSPSFVREPEGNGVAERFIRTLKENLLWVRSFATIEELRLALLAFKRTYNEQWILEQYDYRSPAQVRRDLVGLDAAA